MDHGMTVRLRLVGSLVLLVLLLPRSIAAQGFQPEGFAGIQVAHFGGASATSGLDHRVGVRAGMGFVIPANSFLALATGFTYSEVGGEIDGAAVPGLTGTVRLNYLHLPALLRLGPTLRSERHIRPYLAAGPVLGLQMGCSFKDTGTSNGIDGQCDDPLFKVRTSTFEIELELAGGVEVGRFRVGLSYDLGLTDIASASGRTLKNRSMGLVLGYRFLPD
jgi:hypothetical protein